MQKIGVNPQKNTSPAFGCINCEQAKKILVGKKLPASAVDSFIKENTKATKGGWFSKPQTHEQKAEDLLNKVKDSKLLSTIVGMIKGGDLNYGG